MKNEKWKMENVLPQPRSSILTLEDLQAFDHGPAVMIAGFPDLGFVASRLSFGGNGRVPFAVLPIHLVLLNEVIGLLKDRQVLRILRQAVHIEGADEGFGFDPPGFVAIGRRLLEGAALVEP